MYTIDQTEAFERTAHKFFKKHRDLLPRFGEVIATLQSDPFSPTLKMHKLKNNIKVLKREYADRVRDYRIIFRIGHRKEVY